ncbi:hypothetical protein GCM10011581_26670 [Saccharopolyspora subtropica]|uniref:Uncharacterized protein n=1 Tax=Saccharopolyspora thermophila TaxID=89367 RepID=A0A917JX10_9PSEU|nr:hypothetical protein [Saccharopolyspora subtropica]GGI88216.1 hypothetical protein GCM10011581_26670 [Saccharopolyspora subtropica]
MAGGGELAGRSGVVEGLVRQCVRRDLRAAGADLPVIVLAGPRGSGKTAALGDIRRRCGMLVPHAASDLEQPDTSPRAIVTELAFELSRKYESSGRIHFRQLMLCLLVVGAQLNPENREKALAQVRAAAAADAEFSERTHTVVEGVIDSVMQGGVVPWWSKLAAETLLRGSESLRWRHRLRRASGIREAVPERSPNLQDVLVDIGAADSDLMDEVFCAAFLADLREAYRGRRGRRRRANCVALLDNVDSPGGMRFLDLLLTLRQRHEPDPLVVVGTSRQWHPRWGQRGVAPEHASLADWADHREPDRGPDSWWYPIDLRDLVPAEVAIVGRFAAGSAAAPFVHELTGGHPWGVQEVRAALGDRPTGSAMRLVLKHRAAGAAPLAERARDYLLRDFDAAQREVLVGLSAAPNLELATRAEVRLGSDGAAGVLHEIRSRLWSVLDHENRLALHPWLRRLLLHELANRPDDHPQRWVVVHTRHREHHRDNGNTALALYHALALQDLGAVVAHLQQRFEQISTEADVHPWLQRLELITAAPNRLPTDREPREQVEQLVRAAPAANANLARLVAAKWLMSDPLGDPGRTLRGIVRSEFEQLARQARAGFVVLFGESEKYA